MFEERIIFDKENKQEDFQYMAKSMKTGDLIIGYVVVEKPWYSRHERMWKYYILKNKYVSSFCGGTTNVGFEKELVNKDSIRPFDQIAKIKYNQEANIKTYVTDKDDNTIVVIKPDDSIPYGLWGISDV